VANVKLTDTLREKIRIEYVQGYEEIAGNRVLFSLDELGKTHNVAQSTLYRHSLQDGWKGQRERFQENYLAQLDKQRTQSLIADSKKFDNPHVLSSSAFDLAGLHKPNHPDNRVLSILNIRRRALNIVSGSPSG